MYVSVSVSVYSLSVYSTDPYGVTISGASVKSNLIGIFTSLRKFGYPHGGVDANAELFGLASPVDRGGTHACRQSSHHRVLCSAGLISLRGQCCAWIASLLVPRLGVPGEPVYGCGMRRESRHRFSCLRCHFIGFSS